jgi:hypothetical protein
VPPPAGRTCRCAGHARIWPGALATRRHNDQFGTQCKRSSDGGAANQSGGSRATTATSDRHTARLPIQRIDELIAEYLHLSEGGRRRPIKHRSARSGRPQRYPLPAESCGTAAVSPFAIMGRRPSRYGIQARDV